MEFLLIGCGGEVGQVGKGLVIVGTAEERNPPLDLQRESY